MTRLQAEQFLANFGLSPEAPKKHLNMNIVRVMTIAAFRWHGQSFAERIGGCFTPAGKEKGGYFFQYPTEKQLPNLVLHAFQRGEVMKL